MSLRSLSETDRTGLGDAALASPAPTDWSLPEPDQIASRSSAARLIPLIRLDQRRRWQSGQRTTAEDYLTRYPVLAADREAALDVIYSEILLCEEFGQSPQVADYAARFPQYAAELSPLFQVHQAVGSTPRERAAGEDGDTAASERTLAEDGAAPPAPPCGTAGAVPSIAGYEILAEVGRGAMGVVYQARQRRPERIVALKMLLGGAVASAAARRRLLTEAQAAARLQHPGIVPILEVGTQAAGPYFSMAFVEGTSLADLIREHPLAPQRAARYVQEIASAIHYAHGQGVLHRDLKPSNVLIDRHDRPHVTDFGLAKCLSSDSDDNGAGQHFAAATATGDVLGTPGYMPPEQAGGRTALVGPASDIYALGATLYALLTGRPPFQSATTLDTLLAVIESEPPAPRLLNRQVPRDLETICLKCLQKEPQARYATAAEVAEELRAFLAGEPIRARPISAAHRLVRWCRRKPIIAGLAASVLLLALLLSIGSTIAAVILRHERNQTQQQLVLTTKAERSAVAAEELAQRRLFDAKVAEARARRLSGAVGQRVESWQAVVEAARLAESLKLGEPERQLLRQEAIASLALVDLKRAKQWNGAPKWTRDNLAFDAELTRYARGDVFGNVSVRSVADDRELAVLPGRGVAASRLAFNPAGDLLAIRFDQTAREHSKSLLEVWDWERKARAYQPESALGEGGIEFSASGQKLAIVREPGKVAILSADSGRQILELAIRGLPGHTVFDDAGKRLALVSNSSNFVEVFDTESGQRICDLDHAAPVLDVAWHPSGNMLAAGANDGNVYLWNMTSMRKVSVLRGHRSAVIGVDFSPDGQLLVSRSWDETDYLWCPWTGQQLLGFRGAYSDFSKDGSRILSNYGTELLLWEVIGGGHRATLPEYFAAAVGTNSDSLSADGRWLAVACNDGVRLWDLRLNDQVAYLPIGPTIGVAFHPSGAEFFTAGMYGLHRWSMQQSEGIVRIGPPRRMPIDRSLQRVKVSADGTTIACIGYEGAYVLDSASGQLKYPLMPHRMGTFIDVSPDGKLIATSTWNGYGIKVWNAASGKFMRGLLPEARSGEVLFSADGRHLITITDVATFWDTQTWNKVRTLPRPLAGGQTGCMDFSRDGRLMAFVATPGEVQLFDNASQRLLATLPSPPGEPSSRLAFHPSGDRLYVTTGEVGGVHAWNLRGLRSELATLGLDWADDAAVGTAAMQPAMGANSPAPRDQIEWDLGELGPQPRSESIAAAAGVRQQISVLDAQLAASADPAIYFRRGQLHRRVGDLAAALADWDKAVELSPETKSFRLSRAEALVEQDRLDEAAQEYSQVLARDSRAVQALVGRGLVRSHQGRFAETIGDLDRALEINPRDAMALHYRSLVHSIGPSELRDPRRAMELAAESARLRPSAPYFPSALAIAHYRLGEYEQAVSVLLELQAALRRDLTAWDAYFLAMCYHKLGRPDEARQAFDVGNSWWQFQPHVPRCQAAWLEQFRSEATAVLRNEPGEPGDQASKSVSTRP